MAAPQSIGPPEYSSAWVGYGTSDRWFRYVSTTVTVPPQVVPRSPGAPSQRGDATIWLNGIGSVVPTQITVAPAGGPVSWGDPGGSGTFRISPRTGDRLTLSIYYDQRGHVYLTATDVSRHTTQTVRTNVPKMTYLHARLFAWVYNDVTPPLADTPLWQFTNSRLTTYRGDHGTIVGPWTTSKTIVSTAGTASGTVIASPSGLSNGGEDFTAWFRALPLTYTQGFAGYAGSGGLFRFIATTLTVPARQDPPAGSEYVQVSLGHHGGVAYRSPEADLGVLAGGGPGSIFYGGNTTSGHFTISPGVGDRLTVSIYYDQHGHYFFTATDLTQHTTQTVTTTAFYADQMPLNYAGVLGYLDTAFPPPADVRLWDFTGTRVTTYGGTRGSILGPWAASQTIDTTDGTAAGAVVMSPSALSNGGQDFTVWLRHR